VDCPRALEAEQFAFLILYFDNTVRVESDPLPGLSTMRLAIVIP
jgi:hypothetical protein